MKQDVNECVDQSVETRLRTEYIDIPSQAQAHNSLEVEIDINQYQAVNVMNNRVQVVVFDSWYGI
jgi:hypothetical protein